MAKKGLHSCQKVKKETKPENFKIFDYEISSINKINNKVQFTINYTFGLHETTNSN